MNSFAIAQAGSFEAAATAAADRKYSLPVLKAGGIDVLDHLKEGLISPDVLINVRRVKGEQDMIRIADKGLRLEANATLSDLAASTIVLREAPVLAQSAASAATPAIRNVASAAGNLLQRPRCWYYRNDQFACLKKGGSMCFAVDGENAHHAIFGPGPCHIVHPSNIAPALMVLGATVHLVGSARKSIPLADLYHMPDKGVTSEHNLERGEVITHITCGVAPTSGFYAVKAKQSFDWPSAFACVALDVKDGAIASAKVCAGAVAPVPWMLPAVADALKGVKVTDAAAIAKAASFAVQGATPMTDNKYKLTLLTTCVKRAVMKALGQEVPGFTEVSA
jgi:xanthine dehydrogenase YagS FAD-binding subunit